VSESPNDGQHAGGQYGDGQYGDGQYGDGQYGDGQSNDGQPVSGQPASQQPSEPTGQRYTDWRNDGSVGRFTEPPSRPASETTGSRPGPSSGDRPGTSSQRPGASSSDRAGDRSNGRSGDRYGDRADSRSGRQGGDKAAGDPVTDFQRWLMKAGARSMANQVADNVRRTIGQEKRSKGDVWDTATTEPPPDESPECQWCPVCQAARRMRLSGPGIGDKLVNAGGVLASVVQDAFSVVEQAMKTPPEDNPQDKAS
jgi:hypothetical protein